MSKLILYTYSIQIFEGSYQNSTEKVKDVLHEMSTRITFELAQLLRRKKRERDDKRVLKNYRAIKAMNPVRAFTS